VAAAAPDFIGAGEAVRIRVGEHPDRTRLVFDWPAPVGVATAIDGPRATISFDRPARLDLRHVKAHRAKRLIRMHPTPGAQDLVVDLAGPPGGAVKVFTLDKRVVVDVFGPAGMAQAIAVSSPQSALALAQAPAPAAVASAGAPDGRSFAALAIAVAAAPADEDAPTARPQTLRVDGFYVAGRIGGAFSALGGVDPRFGGEINEDRPGA